MVIMALIPLMKLEYHIKSKNMKYIVHNLIYFTVLFLGSE